ncbi:10581_t:CDS:1, partial [Paraglomus brasilianum]
TAKKTKKKVVSQFIISLKAALESVDNLTRFVNDPPSGFDRKALSVLRLLKSQFLY